MHSINFKTLKSMMLRTGQKRTFFNFLKLVIFKNFKIGLKLIKWQKTFPIPKMGRSSVVLKKSATVFVQNPIQNFHKKHFRVFVSHFTGINLHRIPTKLIAKNEPLFGEEIHTEIKVPEVLKIALTEKCVTKETPYRFYANETYSMFKT